VWKQARGYYEQNAAGWPRRLAEESPVPVRLSVLRLGDAAICTNPGELFVEYGLALREHSPARVTLISDLTDGYVGYVPTHLAFERGGYETWPAPGSQLMPEAGDAIVRPTLDLLESAFAAGEG
jgi:neutral ceramidase